LVTATATTTQTDPTRTDPHWGGRARDRAGRPRRDSRRGWVSSV